MDIMTIITKNEAETVREGEKLGRKLRPGDVVALYGGLGTGKTTFTRGLALGLGIDMAVSSPTFTIVNEYLGNPPLFHFDLYRIDSADELFDIGWDDYLDRSGICVVEWSEKAPGALPPEAITVRLETLDETARRIDVEIRVKS